jgi:N-acetylmuramate 1-kinase
MGSTDEGRASRREAWLRARLGGRLLGTERASEDASFRSYLRVRTPEATFILMDAPPGLEDCRPFVEVAARLSAAGLSVPRVHAADLEDGFLLLDDLGTRSYLQSLDGDSADRLYGDAIDALATMQGQVPDAGLPPYDEARLRAELALFPEWCLGHHLGLDKAETHPPALDEVYDRLVAACLEQPRGFVHRDYHSRNLMVLEDGNPGILDFQDAVSGPATYDLVSLLRDVYLVWPRDRVEGWVTEAHARLRRAGRLEGVDEGTFSRWFDLTGVQRHLKVAGIFCRLWHRDGKAGYLADLPRTVAYLVEVCARHPELEPLGAFIEDIGLEARLASPGTRAGDEGAARP